VSYLNANIPPIYCKIRKEYLYDLDPKYKNESEECIIFGIASIAGRAILFHIMLPNGAVYYRLPISAFFQKRFHRSEVPDMSVDSLQLWNCFSYYPAVTYFDFLGGQRGKFFGNKNISVHIFWSLATAIMLLSLIIGSFGIFLVILLKSISQTIKYKLHIGT
jgi:hypothetical protein